ncbi:MAG: hypothetical protein CL802_13595 [Citromicrobium sp.]|nr:hypothetical protein [Citromicrobium sp.]
MSLLAHAGLLSYKSNSMQDAPNKIAHNSGCGPSAVVLQFPSMGQHRKDLSNLPNRVRYWRLERGMTLKEAAAQIGTAFGHLQRIETGARELSTVWMRKIATVFDVTPADLLSIEDGGLDPKERRIVETRRQIPEAHRQSIDAVAEAQQPFRGAAEMVPLRLRSDDDQSPDEAPPRKTA